MYLTPYWSWMLRSLWCAAATSSAVMPRMSWRSIKIGMKASFCPSPARLRTFGQMFWFDVLSRPLASPSTPAGAKGGVAARLRPPAPRNRRSLDDERRVEGHRPRHVVEVGRGRHHGIVDFGELLSSAVTLDANGVAETLVTVRHIGIDAKEAAEIDLAFGLDSQAFEGDPAHRALRHVPHRHAGVERRDQVLLGIGEAVRAAQLVRLIDVEREPAWYILAADAEPRDLGAAPGLALPSRGDTPACLGF